jgi:hypothetical protein
LAGSACLLWSLNLKVDSQKNQALWYANQVDRLLQLLLARWSQYCLLCSSLLRNK